MFTTNLAVAPPIVVSRDHLQATHGHARAVVSTAGAPTPAPATRARQVAHLMAAETARAVDCEAEEVLVMSTGVIGVQLDPRTVTPGIIDAADAALGGRQHAGALAIMTTDPFPKERAVEVTRRPGDVPPSAASARAPA